MVRQARGNVMKLIIRIASVVFLLTLSYEETQAVWTTVILSIMFISVEALHFMLMFISKQVTFASRQMADIEKLLNK